MENTINSIDLASINYEKLFETLITWLASTGIKLLVGIFVISIGFKLVKKLVNKIVSILESKNVDVTLIRFLSALTATTLRVVLILIILGYWGADLSSIAALMASAGVAIGLALQGSLSNFAGGFIILLLRPFKVGDYIETSGYNGSVEQIGLFYTNLLTVDNKQILIPNGILSNGSLVNYSAKQTRRVDIVFGVGYENNIYKVKQALQSVIDSNKDILREPEPFIGVSAHNASSVDFVVRAWCTTENYWDVHHYLLEQVKVKFDEENISIPYPQMDLHVKKYDIEKI